MTTLQDHMIPRDLVECLRVEARNAANPPTEYVLADDGGRMVHKPKPDLDMAELLDQAANRITADGATIARLRAELREAEHTRDGYMAERDMARERLEWSPDQPYDGIAARDETIARLTRNRDMWKGQCERQAGVIEPLREAREELARVRKLGEGLAAALKALPVEEWVEQERDGSPLLIGYVMQAQGEWDTARAALAAWEGQE